MSEVQLIFPGGHLGEVDGEPPLDFAMRLIGVAFGEDGDWNSKYGANVENDVFLMKRFCWCDKDGECPWCTGCGAYEDTCKACAIRHNHGPTCYRTAEKQAMAEWERANPHAEKHGAGWFEQQRLVWKRLCAERGLSEYGCALHCDCGAKERGAAADADGLSCDYQTGKGIFAPFAPVQHDHKRHYYDPPNFWFKPTDFRVIWYKYIGRDMRANRDDLDGSFLDQVFATHPGGMTIKDALDKLADETRANREAFARVIELANAGALDDLFGSTTPE